MPCKGATAAKPRAKVQRCKGERQRYISRSRVSAVGSQVRVIRCGCGCGPEPVPEPEHLNQIPEGRDLGPEKRVLAVSGWRLGTKKDSGCDVIASLPDAILCHPPPGAATCHLKWFSNSTVVTRSRPYQRHRPLRLKNRHSGDFGNAESYNLATFRLNRGYLVRFL